MTVLQDVHEDHGATFTERGDRRVVDSYGRPDRTHRAVRNVVGVCEFGYGVLVVTGDDRVEFVDNAVSNRVPAADGQGCYALLLDPQGKITTDMYVYNAGERLLVFLPPSRTEAVAEDWGDKTFIQDVEIRVATDDFAVFGVHGPKATEKIASVLNNAASPEAPLSFVRGSMRDIGVTVVRADGLAGEEGFEVICAAESAEHVFDTLVNRGMNAAPFGYRVWNSLTLEAGTPLFESELEGRIPNVAGIRNALDFEKGCYVGQEVVSRVENRGRPSKRLVGLTAEAVPDAGAAVFAGDSAVGEVTRGIESPDREEPIALAFVEFEADSEDLTVRVDGQDVAAELVELPFVEGSDRSARLPAYESAE
ncbi:CAF17-like 4Fe-4S cluster assembly/insertion protein YgfZ [Halorientalis salina]|uniref:CAF17-like 4Fe-4S cluster assembly/insertion protein YgfZ n=1 Tax=Halorientalis salina TaxID=2932266 RepID=UPI0010AC15D3|nr:aminomethyltransferase family protein [Halorientalis salina]